MYKLNESKYQYFEEINQGIIRNIGSGLKVFDVGCGFGALGEEIKKKNNIVYGIDISEYALNMARNRLDGAFLADATKINEFPEKIIDEAPYDLIIFSDILEHVHNPFKLLQDYSEFIKQDGYIIISIPNIASWNVRISLLLGNFTYQDRGVLDRTHIRFFTKKTATDLIDKAGYTIEKIDITPNFLRPLFPIIKRYMTESKNTETDRRAIIDSKQYKSYLKMILPLETSLARIWKNLFAFQFVFICSSKNE